MDYGPIPGWAILAIIGAVSISFFAYQVWKATRLVMLGKPDNRFDNWPARIKEVATGWLGQKKVLEDKIAGGIHVLMFWGFLMLSTDMFDLATANWFSHSLLPEVVKGPWNLMVETGYTIALVGCVAALTQESRIYSGEVERQVTTRRQCHSFTHYDNHRYLFLC